MKVLFISSWYPNSREPLKGLFVKRHAQAIHVAGVDIQVLALTISPSKQYFEKKTGKTTDERGVITHSIEISSKFYKVIHLSLFWQWWILKKYYKKNIKENFQPQIIHSNVLYPAAILGYLLSKKEKLPHVITEHWSKVDKFLETSLYARMGLKTYYFADSITTVSNFLKKSLGKHVGKISKMEVVPNIVNEAYFNGSKTEQPADKIVFTCVAQWRAPKRPDLIFNALEYVSKQIGKTCYLQVVGEGPLIKGLKEKKWNFVVEYKGNLGATELSQALQKSDFFLHASDMETFSIVTAEALATGTPVLVSNTGALPELVNASCGVSTYNTPEDWANGIFELINKPNFDHEKIRSQALRFNEKEIGLQFKSIYESKLNF